MPDFIIESPHTKEECLTALDQALADNNLSTFKYGCGSGDHTAYALVSASSESEARRLVPRLVRDKAHVRPVGPITAEQVRQYHTAA